MKFDFFKEKTQPLVGVDISASSVKMVELSTGSKGGYHLEGYAIASLAKDAVVDGNIAGLEQVADAVKRAWKLLGSREKRTALALPAASVKKSLCLAACAKKTWSCKSRAKPINTFPFR